MQEWDKLLSQLSFNNRATEKTITYEHNKENFERNFDFKFIQINWWGAAKNDGIAEFNEIEGISETSKMPSHQTSNGNHHHNGHRSKRRRRDQSEVSCCLKYVIFGFNVIFWVRPSIKSSIVNNP